MRRCQNTDRVGTNCGSRICDAWRSTAGSTSVCTESLPIADQQRPNPLISVDNSVSLQTISSSIWRRIPTGTAGLEGVECPSNPRSYRWGRRRSRRCTEGSIRNSRGCTRSCSRRCESPRKNTGWIRRWRLPEVYRRPRLRIVRGEGLAGIERREAAPFDPEATVGYDRSPPAIQDALPASSRLAYSVVAGSL